MMLVHRSSKGRNSGQRNGDGVYIGHEKIVDIAGIGFVEVEAPDLVTDVWPLKGGRNRVTLTLPISIRIVKVWGPNVGMMSTRWNNKTRGNLLHKED